MAYQNWTSAPFVPPTITVAPDETPYPAPIGTFTPSNFSGVNIAGAENSYPASSQFNYIYPQTIELDYFSGKGFGLIRMPVKMRRLQPVSFGPLDPINRTDEPAVSGSMPGTQTNLLAIKAVLDYAFTKNMYVVIDPHDFGSLPDTYYNGLFRYFGSDPKGTDQFVDWWKRIVTVFKNYPNVIWGLQNEPNGMSAADWKVGAVAAINAIAAITITQWVFIPGASFTGGHSWVSSGNSVAWAGYVKPTSLKIAFEMHEYLDSDFSGTHAVCALDGSTPMVGATSWATTNGFKIWIGEVGWSQDVSCPSDASTLMSYFKANSSIYMGFSYWLGGSSAFYGSYMFTVVPLGYPTGPFTDKPQMSILTANII